MASRTYNPLTIAPSVEDLLAHQRHTDWLIAQEQGRNRNGRAYLRGGPQGSAKTKRARLKRACRRKVRDY